MDPINPIAGNPEALNQSSNPSQIPDSKPQIPSDNHWISILAMAIFIIFCLGVVIFLYYQNQQLKSMLASYQVQPTASPSPTATPDVTANWKTYTNTKYSYSIKYPADYSVTETSFDYVRFSPGATGSGIPQSQTYLSIQLDKSSQQSPGIIYKTTPDGKTLRISRILMDLDENQKPQVDTIFDQILSTFKFTTATSSASPNPSQKGCTLEAKICPDGSTVGRSGPNCEFAPCPQ